MFLLPESPRWLAKNGAHERAQRVLSRIGGESYGEQALREIEATVAKMQTEWICAFCSIVEC